MKRYLALAALLPSLALAQAPAKLGYQGRLLRSDGAPETGAPTITFRILTADTGGSLLWSEDQVLALTDGYYATHLGVVTPINPAIFSGAELFLEIAVNGTALSPRQRIGSTPYSMSSSTADMLDGLDSAAFQRRPAGGISCAANSSIRSIDALGNVVCEADDVGSTSFTAGTGISIASNVISLSNTGCVSGDVWKYNGSTFSCDPDADTNTTYSAGNGLSLTGTTFALSTSGCSNGFVIKYSSGSGTFACMPDTDTTYSGGTGISVASSVVSLSSSGCVNGEVWKFNGSTFNCEPDLDTNTTYSAGAGLSLSGTTFSLNNTGCVSGEILKYNGTGWDCVADDTSAGGGVTNVTASSPITSSGGATPNIALSTTGCVAGEVWKYQGSGNWGCVADDNTTYSAGTGLTLSGTTFSAVVPQTWTGTCGALTETADAWSNAVSLSVTVGYNATLDMSGMLNVHVGGTGSGDNEIDTNLRIRINNVTTVTASDVTYQLLLGDNDETVLTTMGTHDVTPGTYTVDLEYQAETDSDGDPLDDVLKGRFTVRAFPR
jgi:hypothetical protein